jgi:hypothetical protein
VRKGSLLGEFKPDRNIAYGSAGALLKAVSERHYSSGGASVSPDFPTDPGARHAVAVHGSSEQVLGEQYVKDILLECGEVKHRGLMVGRRNKLKKRRSNSNGQKSVRCLRQK